MNINLIKLIYIHERKIYINEYTSKKRLVYNNIYITYYTFYI